MLGAMVMERMLGGLSTRRYPVALEPVGSEVEAGAKSKSKSAVSRRFVAATETALGELLGADLSALDLVAIMIDGVHFGEHCCVVALGIDIDGVKHPLALVEGSTENATLVRDPWNQAVSAPSALSRNSSSFSAGVIQFSVWRGRPFNRSATASSSVCEYPDRSVPFGKY